MGPSSFTLNKKLVPLTFLIFLNFMLRSKLPHDGATLNGFSDSSTFSHQLYKSSATPGLLCMP